MDANVNEWTIYMYTFPNGKRYIGATTQTLSGRRGSDWSKYKGNKIFYAAVQEFGPENIEEAILFKGLMENRIAAELESFFIAAYRTNANRYNNPSYGYNQSDGGEGTTEKHLGDERIEHLHKMMIGFNLENMGSHPSEEVRRRMSEAQWKKRGPSPLEIRQELSENMRKYNAEKKQNDENADQQPKKHSISVVVHNFATGKTLRFPSINSTAKYFGVSFDNVNGWLSGKKPMPSGYLYVKDGDDTIDLNWDIVDIPDKRRSRSDNALPVIFHDNVRNVTMRFDSIAKLCRYFKMTIPKRISAWINGKEEQPDGFLFIKEVDVPNGCDWNIVQVTDEQIEIGDSFYNFLKILRDTSCKLSPIITHNPETNETLRFKCVADAAQYYGLCYETVSRWVNGNQHPANGLIVIKEADLDPECNWEIHEIEMDRVPKKKKKFNTSVVVYDEKKNEANLFNSVQNAAFALKVNPNTITRWISGVRRPPAGYTVVNEEDWDFNNGIEVKEVIM